VTNDDKFQLHEFMFPADSGGLRLDRALAMALPQYSRAQLQRWLAAGAVKVSGESPRSSSRVFGGELVQVRAEFPHDHRVAAEELALDIVYQDKALLVINKPAGLVVHPGAGNRTHTLQNALLGFDATLAGVPRAGLVHRLDKDTTGLLVVGRTPESHLKLVAALQAREIGREYLALCHGLIRSGGTVDKAIGRHRSQRTRMAVRGDGRDAVTHFRVAERFAAHTLLRVQLETGRTHQIRVHLAHLGFPVVGDPDYGARSRLITGAKPALKAALQNFRRQALHAARLELEHPLDGEELIFEAPLPDDFAKLVTLLRSHARAVNQ
jgi:23S rRNA pseudouridine1911/1915/1917 synthase